jgi:tetratricopeptide (TPR) repeat protein
LLDHYRLHTEDELERERSRRMASARARRFLQEAERLSLRRLRRIRALWVATALGVTTILFFAVVARKEQERAEANLLAFIKIADKIASDTDWQLSRIAHTLALRQEMQRDMDAKLASTLLQYPTNVEVRVVVIDAKQRRSDFTREDETLSRARQILEESKTLIDRGLAIHLEDKSLQKRLGLYYSKLGKIDLARGDLEAAQRNFNTARQLPVSLDPISDDPDGVRTRATNDSEQGDLELAMSRPARALSMYESAITLMVELVRMKGEGSDYNWSLLSQTLRASAEAARTIGDPASLEMARDRIEQALQLQEPIARMDPGNTYYAWSLARIYLERAELLSQEGQRDAAVDDYEEALRLGRELHEGDPTRKPYGLVLGESLLGCEKIGLCKEDLAGTKKAQRERLAQKFLSEDGEDDRFRNLLHPENR